MLDLEMLLRDQRRHDIAVVALRHRGKAVGAVGAGSLEDVDIDARAEHEIAGKVAGRAAGTRPNFRQRPRRMAGARKTFGQRRTDAAATDDEITHEVLDSEINDQTWVRCGPMFWMRVRESPGRTVQRKEAPEHRSNESRSAPVGA